MISHCKTAQCDYKGCGAQRVFVGYSEAQHATLLLREDGWWVGDNTGIVFCPEHAMEVEHV